MADAVIQTDLKALTLVHQGKVRDMYMIPGHDDKLLMIASDRISAYDVVMNDPIPGKGKILTQLSLFWFELLGDIVENHLITADVSKFPKICHQYADVLEGRIHARRENQATAGRVHRPRLYFRLILERLQEKHDGMRF